MRKLYLLSKPLKYGDSEELRPRLIGELTEENGEYKFEYKLGGKLQEWFLEVDEFPDVTKTYKGAEVKKFISSFIPQPNDNHIKKFMQDAKLNHYDEWGFIRYCGKHMPHSDAMLSENIPNGAIIYERMGI